MLSDAKYIEGWDADMVDPKVRDAIPETLFGLPVVSRDLGIGDAQIVLGDADDFAAWVDALTAARKLDV